jgi:hypothetical protein
MGMRFDRRLSNQRTVKPRPRWTLSLSLCLNRLFAIMLRSHHGFGVAAAGATTLELLVTAIGATSGSFHTQKIAQRKFNETYSRAALARLRTNAFLRRGSSFDLPSQPALFCRHLRSRRSLHPSPQPTGFGQLRTSRSVFRGDHRV